MTRRPMTRRPRFVPFSKLGQKQLGRNRTQDILENHLAELVIFDVLPPMKYESAAAYRRSWDEWQPETQDEGQFDLEDLVIVAGVDVAAAYCFIRCGERRPR